MNQPIILTQDAFNSLLANLVELEEGIGEIIDVFFREPSKDAEDLKKVLKDYMCWMDAMVKRVNVMATADNDFPYVVIGSEVIVEDSGGSGTYNYRLVSPLKNKVDSNEISFLSPMGRAMLLKRVNQSFVVEAPGGNFEYKILAVKIPGDSLNVDAVGASGKADGSKGTKQSNIV